MNYEKIYNDLLDKYGTYEKPKGVYTERHRKIPGHAGGEYVEGNAFYVPARVHYIAHLLLARVTGHQKDRFAVWGMMNQRSINQERDYRVTSYLYATAREACLPMWREFGLKIGKRSVELGLGFFAMSKEQIQANAKKAALICHKKKTKDGKSAHAVKLGIAYTERLKSDPQFAREVSDRSSAIGKKNAELGLGIHGLSSERRSEISKVAGAKAASVLHTRFAHAKKHREASPYWAQYQRKVKNTAQANRANSKSRVDAICLEVDRAKPLRDECVELCRLLGVGLRINPSSSYGKFSLYLAELKESQATGDLSPQLLEDKRRFEQIKKAREDCLDLCHLLDIKFSINPNSGLSRLITYRAQLQAMLSTKETVNG